MANQLCQNLIYHCLAQLKQRVERYFLPLPLQSLVMRVYDSGGGNLGSEGGYNPPPPKGGDGERATPIV